MKSFAVISAFVISAALAIGAEPEQLLKRSEAMKLIHYTEQLSHFRDVAKAAIGGTREQHPEFPLWFWEELEREVSVDAYAQWIAGLFEQGLTMTELQQLNAIFGNDKKKALLDELIGFLTGKKGEDFVRAVHEFRESHDPQAADEIINFMRSPLAAKHSVVLGEIKSGEKEIVVRLIVEADRRVRLRHK